MARYDDRSIWGAWWGWLVVGWAGLMGGLVLGHSWSFAMASSSWMVGIVLVGNYCR